MSVKKVQNKNYSDNLGKKIKVVWIHSLTSRRFASKIMNDFFLHPQQSRTFHMKSSRKSTMENKRGFSEIYDQWKGTKNEDLERLKD